MKTVQVIKPFIVSPGTVMELTEKQASTRMNKLGEINGADGFYRVLEPIMFKAGEVIVIDGEISKVDAQFLSLISDDDINLQPSGKNPEAKNPPDGNPANPAIPSADLQPDMEVGTLMEAKDLNWNDVRIVLKEYDVTISRKTDVVPGEVVFAVLNDVSPDVVKQSKNTEYKSMEDLAKTLGLTEEEAKELLTQYGVDVSSDQIYFDHQIFDQIIAEAAAADTEEGNVDNGDTEDDDNV